MKTKKILPLFLLSIATISGCNGSNGKSKNPITPQIEKVYQDTATGNLWIDISTYDTYCDSLRVKFDDDDNDYTAYYLGGPDAMTHNLSVEILLCKTDENNISSFTTTPYDGSEKQYSFRGAKNISFKVFYGEYSLYSKGNESKPINYSVKNHPNSTCNIKEKGINNSFVLLSESESMPNEYGFIKENDSQYSFKKITYNNEGKVEGRNKFVPSYSSGKDYANLFEYIPIPYNVIIEEEFKLYLKYATDNLIKPLSDTVDVAFNSLNEANIFIRYKATDTSMVSDWIRIVFEK